jgi:hypothetical protein
MNAERLHAIVIALRNELAERRISAKMQKMVTSLEAVVNQSNPQNQQNFSASLNALYDAITETNSDKFSPTWR